MIKQIKNIDRELLLNGLTRIADPSHRCEGSLFRALAMAVLSTHEEWPCIRSYLKLTLACTLADKKTNPFPNIPDTCGFIRKYRKNPELVSDFLAHPDYVCFQRDCFEIASCVFNRRISVYSLDSDQYLHELIICLGRANHRPALMLARVAGKYFCVEKVLRASTVVFIKESILEQIIRRLGSSEKSESGDKQELLEEKETGKCGKSENKENKIHYPNYDEVVSPQQHRRHKKSMSDCGEMIGLLDIARRDKEHEKSTQAKGESTYKEQHIFTTASGPMFKEQIFAVGSAFQDQVYDNNNGLQSPCLMPSPICSLSPSYPLEQLHAYSLETGYSLEAPYEYYQPQESSLCPEYPYVEQVAPVNNQRYRGRLKFFDHSGNYGFLIVDDLNIDLFVHYDDLSKAGLSKDKLANLKNHYELQFQFTYFEYDGRQKKSKKAVDLVLIPE